MFKNINIIVSISISLVIKLLVRVWFEQVPSRQGEATSGAPRHKS